MMYQTKPFRFVDVKNAFLYIFYYLKYFHNFMFAHKPLCERHIHDTVKVGNFYICRSCVFLYLGILVGSCIALSLKINFLSTIFMLFVIIFVSAPKIYSNYSRKSRDFLRLLLGFFMSITFITSFRIGVLAFLGTVVAFHFIKKVMNSKRNPERFCKGCSKLGQNTACEGYKKQTQALLDMEEAFSKHLIIRKEVLYDK